MKANQKVQDGRLPPLTPITRDLCGQVLTKMLTNFTGLAMSMQSHTMDKDGDTVSNGLIRMVATTKNSVIYGCGLTLPEALANVICESYLISKRS